MADENGRSTQDAARKNGDKRKGNSWISDHGGGLSGCGVFILLFVIIGVVTMVLSMHSNSGAAISIDGPGRGKTAVDLMHERIIGSAIIAVAGAIIGAIIGFITAGVAGIRRNGKGRRPSNAAELIANGYSDEPMKTSPALAYQPEERDDPSDRRKLILGTVVWVLVFTLIGAGYGLWATVTNVRSLAQGPVDAQVGRPTVTTKYKSDDDGSWYDCTLHFTVTEGAQVGKTLSFDVSTCAGEDGKQPDPDTRLVHDLQGVDGDKLLLEYYDAFRWPVYVGVKPDPAYS